MTSSGCARNVAYSDEGRMLFNPTGKVELTRFWKISSVSEGAGGGAAKIGVSKWMVLAKIDK